MSWNSKPFLLRPAGKDYLWGGRRLNDEFAKGIDLDPLAETWECSTHPDGPSMAASGEFAGQTLPQVLQTHPEFLGRRHADGKFPLLIKFIDATKDLSVQVHPDDEYARIHENGQNGKSEMWYVLDARKGAKLIYGLRHDCTADELRGAIADGTLLNHLQQVPIRKDDLFFIEAGTIHAIGAGALVAEIQENSNLTYRLYDYDRTDKNGNKRELHTDKASQVIKTSFDTKNVTVNKSITASNGVTAKILCECPMFSASSICISAGNKFNFSKSGHMLHIMCVSGSGVLESDNVKYSINKGDSYLLPLALSDACAKAVSDMELIVSH